MIAQVGETQLYFKEDGKGLPLIVHHGGPGFDHTTICPFLGALAAHMRVICFDHRGTGQSSGPERADRYRFEDFVDDLEGLRRHLGLDKFALLGHSFGGMVAQHYALAYPERLSHLVLVCTAASNEFIQEGMANLRGKVSLEVWRELDCISHEPPTAENMKRAFVLQAPVFFRSPAGIAAIDLDAVKWGPHSLAAWAHIARFDLRQCLSEIGAPTLVIGGRHDLGIAPCFSEELARLIPGATLAISEHSAHFPYMEDEKWFMEEVERFIGGQELPGNVQGPRAQAVGEIKAP